MTWLRGDASGPGCVDGASFGCAPPKRSGGAAKVFDLATDHREQANLAARRPDELAALKAAWEKVNATLLPY